MRHAHLFSLLLILVAATAGAQVDTPQIIAAAPDSDQFPAEDVVVLYRSETIELTDDGLLTRRLHLIQRLQTQWAMRSRSDVRVAWDAARQDLEVVTARTFMRDGTVIETPANGFNEVTPDAVRRAAPFLDIREMVISLVGTEPGCVTELEYVISDRAPRILPPGGECWLVGEDPVLESRVTLVGVQGALAGTTDRVLVEHEAGSWIAHDLPACRAEGAEAWRHRFTPHVIWSAASDMERLAGALRQQTEAAAGALHGLQGWLSRTRADAEVLTEVDLLQQLADLLHAGIAGVHLPAGTDLRPPRLAEDVYDSAVGTDWERAVVALTVLREAGYQPELGLFGRDAVADGLPPTTVRFTRYRVVVRVDDQNWWLAPDRDEAWSGHCDLTGWTGLFLAADGGQRLYTVPIRPGLCRWTAHLAPDGDGWSATADLVLRGPYRRPGDTGDLADELAAALLPDAEVSSLDVRVDTADELSLRFTARGQELAAVNDGLLTREIPWPTDALLDHLPAGFRPEQPARQAPLVITTPGREEASLSIELPEGWRVDTPAVVAMTRSAAQGSCDLRTGQAGRTLTITRTLELNAGPVAAEDYPPFRELVTAALAQQRQPLVILVP